MIRNNPIIGILRCEPGKVEAVAGVNLPMLLRTLTYRERETLHGLVNRAVSGGRDGVMAMRTTRDAKT